MSGNGVSSEMGANKFDPQDLSGSKPVLQLPGELWQSVYLQKCPFSGDIFLSVMENLVRNPNITSSLVFRADVYYDSDKDTSIIEQPDLAANHVTPLDTDTLATERSSPSFSPFVQNLRSECRPKGAQVPSGFAWRRTMVCKLVPRNPQLDKYLFHTVHYFQSNSGADGQLEHLVLKIPHVTRAEDIPWYYPAVKSLAILFSARVDQREQETEATESRIESDRTQSAISIHYSFIYPPCPAALADSPLMTARLTRTAHHLLRTIHRHGVGELDGYVKRAHHDQIVPQARLQDTYTRLKTRYARALARDWREQTDPTKHVFEDLGIAAFLIELWHDMYDVSPHGDDAAAPNAQRHRDEAKKPFPGFVDVGCGNGVLVHILLSEGYKGWGFDARRRKSWDMFPNDVQLNLKEFRFVPDIFRDVGVGSHHESQGTLLPEGVFIVSNHADELTLWAPIMASLSRSSFIAIPCCSHDFSGSKFRAPSTESSLQKFNHTSISAGISSVTSACDDAQDHAKGKGHQTGSLKRPTQPSAYATLTEYVSHITTELGFLPEKELLRIPSTRNACVLGRNSSEENFNLTLQERRARADDLVERELQRIGKSLKQAADIWMKKFGETKELKPGHPGED